MSDLDVLLKNYDEYKQLFDDCSRDDEASCSINISEGNIEKELHEKLFTLKNINKYITKVFEENSKIINIDDAPEESVQEIKYEREFKKLNKHKQEWKNNDKYQSKYEKDDKNKEKKQRHKKDKPKNHGKYTIQLITICRGNFRSVLNEDLIFFL